MLTLLVHAAHRGAHVAPRSMVIRGYRITQGEGGQFSELIPAKRRGPLGICPPLAESAGRISLVWLFERR